MIYLLLIFICVLSPAVFAGKDVVKAQVKKVKAEPFRSERCVPYSKRSPFVKSKERGGAFKFVGTISRGNDAWDLLLGSHDSVYIRDKTEKPEKMTVKLISQTIHEPDKCVGMRLSFGAQNIPTRAAIELLSKFSCSNIVVSDAVGGNVTLELHDISWIKILDLILKSNGLGKRKVGNSLLVAPINDIVSQEKEELLAKKQISNLEPLHTALIQINYSKAKDISKLIKEGKNSVLSSRGVVRVDVRTNTIWVQDTSQRLIDLQKIIKKLDIPVKQVLIEARLVNIDKKYERALGIHWGTTKPTYVGSKEEVTETIDAQQIIPKRQLNVDLPVSGKDMEMGPASIGIALARLGGGILLDLELAALQTEGDAQIIAKPRLLTMNQKEAIIASGEEIPYQEAASSGATSTAFKQAVLRLKVTPQITPDNKIILDLNVNQDKRGPDSSSGIPTIDTQKLITQVLVDNGKTIVLGGIYKKSTNNSSKRVPFFSDLPIVGHLFRYVKKEKDQRELLIFITPKVIN